MVTILTINIEFGKYSDHEIEGKVYKMNTTAFFYQVAAVLRGLFRGFHLGDKLG